MFLRVVYIKHIPDSFIHHTYTLFQKTIQCSLPLILFHSFPLSLCIYSIMFPSYYRDTLYFQSIVNIFTSSLTCFRYCCCSCWDMVFFYFALTISDILSCNHFPSRVCLPPSTVTPTIYECTTSHFH